MANRPCGPSGTATLDKVSVELGKSLPLAVDWACAFSVVQVEIARAITAVKTIFVLVCILCPYIYYVFSFLRRVGWHFPEPFQNRPLTFEQARLKFVHGHPLRRSFPGIPQFSGGLHSEY